MFKMLCIRQIKKHYFPFLHYFAQITIFFIFGVCLTEKSQKIQFDIDLYDRWHYTIMNIYINANKYMYISEFKFGMIWYIIIVLMHSFTQWLIKPPSH